MRIFPQWFYLLCMVVGILGLVTSILNLLNGRRK